MGMFEWVDPTREALQKYLRGRTDTVSSVLGAAADMVRDPQARRSAFERAPKPFQMTDADMDAAMSFWNPGGLMAKIVYHGSPHKFDKFDASKIGTGEGAQAYGHGVYLADAEDVAKGYRRELSNNIRVDAKGVWARSKADGKEYGPFESIKDAFAGVPQDSGSLYKADLPDEWIPKMLDWDKPLSQQPQNVRLLAQDLGLAKDATGKDVYSALSNQARDMGIIKGQNAQTTLPGSQSRAATDLSEFGIPGIRYLDGGSRPNSGRISMLEQTIANLQGKGASKAAISNAQRELDAELARASYNYVVFPGLEDQVKILERNGIPLEGMFKMGGK